MVTPVTAVAVPGLGGDRAQLLPFLTGIRRQTAHLDLYDGSLSADADPGYQAPARILLDRLSAHQATAAIGWSFGAGVVLRALITRPDRFAKAALLLPFAFDRPPTRHQHRHLNSLRRPARDRDEARLRELLLSEVDPGIRTNRLTEVWVNATARRFTQPAVQQILGWIPEHHPFSDTDTDQAAATDVELLIIGQANDRVHPAAVAQRIAAAFPRTTLHLLPDTAALWTRRRDIADALAHFLRPTERGQGTARGLIGAPEDRTADSGSSTGTALIPRFPTGKEHHERR